MDVYTYFWFFKRYFFSLFCYGSAGVYSGAGVRPPCLLRAVRQRGCPEDGPACVRYARRPAAGGIRGPVGGDLAVISILIPFLETLASTLSFWIPCQGERRG